MFGRRPNSNQAKICVLGFSANRVWLVSQSTLARSTWLPEHCAAAIRVGPHIVLARPRTTCSAGIENQDRRSTLLGRGSYSQERTFTYTVREVESFGTFKSHFKTYLFREHFV